MTNKIISFFIVTGLVCLVVAYLLGQHLWDRNREIIAVSSSPLPSVSSSPNPSKPIISPSPSQVPTLTPAERAAKYGPCVSVPVLMYHHVAPADTAKAGNFTSLNVTPENFESHLAYLESHNYNVITPAALSDFFENGTPLPSKPVMLTFDDGYDDNGNYAFPLLQKYSMPATIFLVTGLMDNSPYLSWSQVETMSGSGLIEFGNHTWSHHSSSGSSDVITKEISTAGEQLSSRGYNRSRVFAYPYGTSGSTAVQTLSGLNYQLAFTTTHGTWQCKGYRLTLPRIRIGNTVLSAYHL